MALFVAPGLLGELEISDVYGTIIQRQNELAAGSLPSRVCIPTICILIGFGVIAQAARSQRIGGCRTTHRRESCAFDSLRSRFVGWEDVQSIVPPQTEDQ